ncbi:polysaccharide biosynthesis tyrosine autokinase [Plantactinospora solaniradicis]|uniref:Polysaccharide biosynthesis tyrosine autokinase n=1 Tax=Plantactinospora solaniradicis TaxID=1723736 RepID=A0ABW1K911_9ACTN
MTIANSLRALRRSWWLVALATIFALGVVGTVTATAVPRYVTTTTFFVTTPGKGASDVMQGSTFSRERIKSYVDLVGGDRLAGMVAGNHPLGLSVRQVQDRISARAVRDTVLFTVTVTDRAETRSQQLAHAVLTELTSLVETLEGSPGTDASTVRLEVVAGPTPALVASRPTRNLALGLLAGLLAGAAGALLREALDRSVRTPGKLREAAEVPVLAVIPHQVSVARRPALLRGGCSPGAESFRQLRTNLRSVDPTLRILAVASAAPREGRSITAANLAIMAAETGRRVLLLEADLRRPRIAHYLGLQDAPGLSEVLAGRAAAPEVLQQWGRHSLWVMPCGAVPSNPSELLGSGNMSALLKRVRADFDLAVIDTPPLLPLTDAAVVAAAADGVVLLARANRTGHEQVRAMSAALRTVHGRVVGCVLNDVRRRDVGVTYRYPSPRRGAARSRGETDGMPSATAGTVGRRASQPRHATPVAARGPVGVPAAPDGESTVDCPLKSAR